MPEKTKSPSKPRKTSPKRKTVLPKNRKTRADSPPLARAKSRDSITIKGAREHNLKNLSLAIPRDKLVVITGLSGSG